MTQGQVSVDEMWRFAHALPLRNPMTVFTMVMVPKTGYYRTILPHQAEPTTASDSILGAAEAASELAADRLRFSGGAGASLLEKGKPVNPRSRAQAGLARRHKWLMRDARSKSNCGGGDDVSALAPGVEWPEI